MQVYFVSEEGARHEDHLPLGIFSSFEEVEKWFLSLCANYFENTSPEDLFLQKENSENKNVISYEAYFRDDKEYVSSINVYTITVNGPDFSVFDT